MENLPQQIQILFEKIKNKNNKDYRISQNAGVEGHSLAVGMPGHGKTTLLRRECEIRRDMLNHKLFCVYDAGRMDMAFLMFPSVSLFWKKPKVEKKKIVTAKSYNVELLYPATKKIPSNIPANSKVFTIPVTSLDESDISSLTGSSSLEGIKAILNSMEKRISGDTSPNDYLNILGGLLKKTQDIDNIKISHHGTKTLKGKVFLPLQNEGILSSANSLTSLDLEKLIKDRDTISVLVLRHCPQKLWGFIVHYFMNHIFKKLSGIDGSKRIKVKTTISLTEVQDLLEEGSEMGESAISISRSISRILRQYRTANLYLLMDTQLPQKLPDVKDIMQNVYVFKSSLSVIQKCMEIKGIGTRTGLITSDDISLIPFLPKGWFYSLGDEGVNLHKLCWLRSRTYESGEDFYDIYKRVYGKKYGKVAYINTKELLKSNLLEEKKSQELWEREERVFLKKIEEVQSGNNIPIPPKKQKINTIKNTKEKNKIKPKLEENEIEESLPEIPEQIKEEVKLPDETPKEVDEPKSKLDWKDWKKVRSSY